jgi:glyoxylase-like metal-dependent hydrolase (beta-lactamase superfamily II)
MMMNEAFESAGLQVFERGWLSSNNVLFRSVDGSESVLIDSGYVSHAKQTLALVHRSLGTGMLDRILNTHLHSDHCGGNFELQRAFGCAIDVPGGEVDKVDRWDAKQLTFTATGQSCPRFARSGELNGGDEILLGRRIWQVIAAPGHDPESIVLYEPELKLLVSADALWENGFGVVFPELEGIAAFEAVERTLDRIASLDVKWIIPGHGAPFHGLEPAIARAKSRLQSFTLQPDRHARYAAKVLIKFHLLEVERSSKTELTNWLNSTSYLSLCHQRYFTSSSFASWCIALLGELFSNRAIRLDGDYISNY